MIRENVSIKSFNTFGLDAQARYLAAFDGLNALSELLSHKVALDFPRLILGGGSNVLFTRDYDGIIMLNRVKGIALVGEDDQAYYVKAGAGENWHQFVLHTLANGWAGLENLSLIPGNVGASPMQNIGAYGIEIKDRFESLTAFDIEDRKVVVFNNSECEFGYRESVFKRKFKDRFVILDVTYRLPKAADFRTGYGDIERKLEEMKIQTITAQAISDAVISIRQSKLPDPKEIGNAGSFFKNPIVSNTLVESIKKSYPDVVAYPVGDQTSKLAAGWLIDKASWKGKTFGNYGVHKNQALVLVNYGGAHGNEILELSQNIIDDIHSKFGVELEREVNIY